MTETTEKWHAKVGDESQFQLDVLGWLESVGVNPHHIVSITEREPGEYLIDRYGSNEEGKILMDAERKTAARQVEVVRIGVAPPARP